MPQHPPPSPLATAVATGLEAIRSHGSADADLRVVAEGGYFEAPFMFSDAVGNEDTTRLIKNVELLVRGAREYKQYLGHLRHDLGMRTCSFFSSVPVEDKVGIEFHHAPLTLFEVVETVLNHRLVQGHGVTSMTLADEVLQAHMHHLVGLIPLLKSAHLLVHTGALLVHPAMVHGDWVAFLRCYHQGVTPALVAKAIAFLRTTEDDVERALAKVDTSQSRPRLRADAVVPSADELFLLVRTQQIGGPA
jgi:hypothetical protein